MQYHDTRDGQNVDGKQNMTCARFNRRPQTSGGDGGDVTQSGGGDGAVRARGLSDRWRRHTVMQRVCATGLCNFLSL